MLDLILDTSHTVNGQSNPQCHSGVQTRTRVWAAGGAHRTFSIVRLHSHENPDDQTGRGENQRSHQLLWWILIKNDLYKLQKSVS